MTTNAPIEPEAVRITVSPGKAQALRERATVLFGAALILGLIGVGIAASGGSRIVALLLGLGCVTFLALFGLVWDMQTARPDEPKVSGRMLVLKLGPPVVVIFLAIFSLAGYIPGLIVAAALMLTLSVSGMTRNW